MLNLDEIVKTVSGEMLSIILRTVGFVAFAVVLNLVLLVVQWDLIVAALKGGEPVSQSGDSILVLAGVILFPVVFLLLGQKHALQTALSKILKTKKNDIVLFLVEKLYEKNPDLLDPGSKVPLISLNVVEYLTEIFRDLPSVVVKVLRFFVEKTGFYDLFNSSIETYRKESASVPEENRVQVVSEIISNMIPGDVIKSDPKLPLIAAVCNVSLFFV